MTDLTHTMIRIEWDRIGRSPTCVTANGAPVLASAIRLQWPDEDSGTCVPTLTLTQAILPVRHGDPAEIVTTGYLVPHDEWQAFEQWRRDQCRNARERA